MRIAIFGAGAVGSYLAAKLIKSSNHEVFLIARGAHLEALKSKGLKITSINGDFHLETINATENPSDIGPVDTILLTVKGEMVLEAAKNIGPLVKNDTAILPLQNGVESPEIIKRIIKGDHVLGGMCRIFSTIAKPGEINHFGSEPLVVLGELDGEKSERIVKIRDSLLDSHIESYISDNIHRTMWEKLLFVGPIGCLGAVTRAPLGVILNNPETRKLLIALMEEIYEVARKKLIPLKKSIIKESLDYAENSPPNATSSMQRDIIEGNPSELETQTGVIRRLGKILKVETPAHDHIYSALLPMELKARGEVVFPEI